MSKSIVLVSFIVSSFLLGCTPEKQVAEPLYQSNSTVVSASESSSSLVAPLFPELSLDMYAYPKAIATQEDIIIEADDSRFKRDAYLVLVALHMGRENPNQDFSAASRSLDHALQLDPALARRVATQRWVDVFSVLLEMQAIHGTEGQLHSENEMLRDKLEKQTCTINYLESTLEELRKVESDVEKKKRSYR